MWKGLVLSAGTGICAVALFAGSPQAQQPTTVRFGFNALTNNRSGASGAAVQDCGNVTLQGGFNCWAVANTRNPNARALSVAAAPRNVY